MSEGSLFWDRVVCGARSSEGPQRTWRTWLMEVQGNVLSSCTALSILLS